VVKLSTAIRFITPKIKCSTNDSKRSKFRGQDESTPLCIAQRRALRYILTMQKQINKHKIVMERRVLKTTIKSYLQVKTVGEMERQLAAQKLHHTALHNYSFSS
jgi:hypothetical protein